MKSDLRKGNIVIREQVKCLEYDKSIFNYLINDDAFINAKLILSYVSMNGEVDTYELINKCLEINKPIAVPRCENNIMQFYLIKSFNELEHGYYNILEPVTNNIITNFDDSICITPGIVFDKNGNRVGYGGGYYDRFFEKYTGYKIGLCYSECIVLNVPISEYDIPVDMVITEKEKILIKR